MARSRPALVYPRTAHAHLDETRALARLLADRPAGSVMVDVGAHVGGALAPFARLGWQVHAFEPDPDNRAKLVERFGSAERVVIDPRAVGAEPAADVAFYASPESTGVSGLHAFLDSHAPRGRVDVTTVARIADERGLSAIEFLKIDVEGHDLDVLRGVAWDRLRPACIECEFEDNKTRPRGHTAGDIIAFLAERGYAVYVSTWHPIIRYGIRHDWHRLTPAADGPPPGDAWGNLLAFRDDPGGPAVADAFAAVLTTAPDAATD
ncbi:FkbM family methyltransferase [Rhodothalassium salexigens DSM 2132]|uniref:FkbM family methyltransferase n=1 Tax=Rhodothalassium salexigens DSM 2132 TaxID=1188247 RepID=A0A4R2PCX4_RHOSA|nr:FkbM family methyltransferase [Rhodothalassium salexigens]MBB4212169.1 FkbM family methyltransferase [Rhodothalassium salexigens DSM 2132]MBK1638164.1 hypothetical protein [Rhodothalassium salexigens DSM 2132]TCP33043.1 FkbM family methyltransferase [Rhodothalassium salexigens DSM 2132]